MFIIPFLSLGQSSYSEGFDDGYQKGLDSCLKNGMTPICDIPAIGADSYGDGYGVGYSKAKKNCNDGDSEIDVNNNLFKIPGEDYSSYNQGSYSNPQSIPSQGSYSNPQDVAVDNNAFSRGLQQGIAQGVRYAQIAKARKEAEARMKLKHDKKANFNPEIDYESGSYKKISVKNNSKRYNLNYFLPKYWAQAKNRYDEPLDLTWDLTIGRKYQNGRRIQAWIKVLNEINGVEASDYLSKKRYSSKYEFTKNLSFSKSKRRPYGTDIYIAGNNDLSGIGLTKIDDYNHLFIFFRVIPIHSNNLDFEFSITKKAIDYMLYNIYTENSKKIKFGPRRKR